jgi:alkylation response protein AidB-like acyl-CoA dehydrogenase
MTLKGGSFLIEEGNPKDIFISEEFTEEQKMIGEMVKDFCIQEILEPIKKRGREFEADKDLAEIVGQLEKAAELGLCGVAISEEHGGMGLDFNTGLVFSEAISMGLSFATTIGAQTSIGSLPIVYYGNQAQKNRYLPGVASAKLKASYCLTEPTAGSDANSGKTKCVLNSEGTHYLMNGQKMWITNGGFADYSLYLQRLMTMKNFLLLSWRKDLVELQLVLRKKSLVLKALQPFKYSSKTHMSR